MSSNDVVVGQTYWATVAGKHVQVRVIRMDESLTGSKRFEVVDLSSGKTIKLRSGQRLKRVARVLSPEEIPTEQRLVRGCDCPTPCVECRCCPGHAGEIYR